MAISWYKVLIQTQYQEIAAPCGLAMTAEDLSWLLCFARAVIEPGRCFLTPPYSYIVEK